MFKRVWHLIQRISKETASFPKNVKNFGWKVAGYIWKDRVFLGRGKQKYITVVQEFIDREFSGLGEEYRNKQVVYPDNPKVNTVWCCWWQGEEDMPEIVKVCVASIKAALPSDIKFVLITKYNFQEYLSLPQYILEKLNNGVMSITAFSDILRVNLLSKYGGFWIDATVFIPNKMPAKLFESIYFTQKFASGEACPREACLGKWAGFLQCGIAEFFLFAYVRDAYNLWWKKYDCLIDYVILDYIIMSAYKQIPYIKEVIDKVPANNEKLWVMQKLLNEKYNEEVYAEYCTTQYFNKFARTLRPNKEVDGKLTYYGYICDKFLKYNI